MSLNQMRTTDDLTIGYSNLTAKHLHIKAYARGGRQTDACRLLHEYEAHGKILPMKTYQSVISCLFYGHGPGRSQRRAQAWDLFAHMRFVAHPVPDVRLYATMIRSCASIPGESDALRAMDLWNEMVDHQRLTPDVIAYNAIIAACSRNKDYLIESFRLARSMIEGSRDAHGVPHMVPTYETFMGLLQAAKRMRALSRARWLFAEVLRSATLGQLQVNDILMQQLFHAYASYKAPSRKDVRIAADRAGQENDEEPAPLRPATGLVETDGTEDVSGGAPSKAQAVSECEALFKRVLEERESGHGILSKVTLSTRLANAYSGAIYNQSTIDHSIETFRWLHTELGILPDTRSYHQIFACIREYLTKHSDIARTQAVHIAQELWQEWRGRYPNPPVEALRLSREPLDADTSVPARIYGEFEYIIVDTENMWKSMIDILALYVVLPLSVIVWSLTVCAVRIGWTKPCNLCANLRRCIRPLGCGSRKSFHIFAIPRCRFSQSSRLFDSVRLRTSRTTLCLRCCSSRPFRSCITVLSSQNGPAKLRTSLGSRLRTKPNLLGGAIAPGCVRGLALRHQRGRAWPRPNSSDAPNTICG